MHACRGCPSGLAYHLVELLAAPTKVLSAEATLHAKAVHATVHQRLQQLIVHGPNQVC